MQSMEVPPEVDYSALAEVRAREGESHVPFSLTNHVLHAGKALVTDSRVPGRLLGKQLLYEHVGAEPYVVETVKSGYKLVFDEEPPPSFCRNNKSALCDSDFVRAELDRLEKLGCIVKVQQRPFITLPLSSVFSGKKRLVVDASRGLNPYCTARGIKVQI